MSELIYCLRLWAGPGIRRIRERARARLSSPRPPLPLAVFPKPPAYAQRPLPEHVAARMQPIDGHELALARPYLRERAFFYGHPGPHRSRLDPGEIAQRPQFGLVSRQPGDAR